MKKVRFPIYFEVVGYGELELPEDVDTTDEEAVKDFIQSKWEDVPIPSLNEVEEVMDSWEFDRDAPFNIIE